jgi:siroheme synthase-like protein
MTVAAPPYPVNLLLQGRPVLVVGGGTVAASKIRGLLDADAVVHVVAVEVSPAVRELAVTWEQRPYRPGEVAAYRYAVACTDDPAANEQVFLDGEAAGVFVNAADDPKHCSVTLPAKLQRGDLLVTVSTSGQSPALAVWLRDRLAAVIGPEHDALLTLLAQARAELVDEGRVASPGDWRQALDSGMLDLLRAGRPNEARQRLAAALGLPESPPSKPSAKAQ